MDKLGKTRRISFPFPQQLRVFVRARAIGLVGVSIVIGVICGVLVVALNAISQGAHEFLFGLPHGARLSSAQQLDWRRILLVLALGGAALGALMIAAGKRFAGRMADAIEANALHGGRLSFPGSLYIVLQTLISNGCGAAVGLEAAYTQLGSAFASALGINLAARRTDLRLLVGCGAAGAIAAAFSAPLAGAFYGFEVVLGGYSVGSLAPVATSAIVASLVSSSISGHGMLDIAVSLGHPLNSSLGHAVVIATICAGLGIVVMQSVAFIEKSLARFRVPDYAQPVAGAFVVAGLAILSPEVMGSGHGALQQNQVAGLTFQALTILVLLKCCGSAISLGSGFRGGLFFASLLIGTSLGRAYADAINVMTTLNIDPGAAAVTGLAAFGAGVLAAPMTMTVLALELTGDFYITVAAFVAAVVANFIVRETFGYSFATWRFHLRGETIRGPADIGWIRDLTVGRLMRKEAPTAPQDLTIAEAKAKFAPGAEKQFVLTEDGKFVGLVLTGDLYTTDAPPATPVKQLSPARGNATLTPEMSAREALQAFEANECDVMAVVDSRQENRVIGLLTEAHALKRYGEELERQHRAAIGR